MTTARSDRFITLDVFRGMTVFLMIVVNTAGSGAIPFNPLRHAQWHGCTLTDLVFPSFLFAVGNALSFTMGRGGASQRHQLGKILKRTLLIFVIGYLLSWMASVQISSDWSVSIRTFGETRIMGVLQRIALAYGLAALMAVYFSERTIWILSAVLLLLYWLLLFVFGDPGAQYEILTNAARKLDLVILGAEHMYKPGGIPFDPEGLLSTIPAVVSVTIGYLAGKFIRRKGKTYECVSLLLIAGNLFILTALFWSPGLPINKQLWTSSYVLYTSGISLIAVGTLLYFYEMRFWKTGSYFFSVFGRNPLFIYILATVLVVSLRIPVNEDNNLYTFINNVLFQRLAPGPVGSLFFAICFTLVCWLIGYFMDRKRIYIRV